MIKTCELHVCPNGTLGLHLTRAPWDPYPWISGIQKDSSAARCGMRTGDTVLEINDCDVLGLKIIDIAEQVRQHWQSGADYIKIVIWRNKIDNHSDEENFAEDATTEYDNDKAHINQQSLQKFATCLQHISQLLECPVCLEIIRPPSWQCCNGHVLCNNCRSRSIKCPVCRVPLGPRGRCLLADKLFCLLAETLPANKQSAHDRTKPNKNVEESKAEFCKETSPATKDLKESPTKKINERKILELFRSKRQQNISHAESLLRSHYQSTTNTAGNTSNQLQMQATSPTQNLSN